MDRGTWWSRLHDRQMDLSFRVGLVMLAAVYAVLGLLIQPGWEPAASAHRLDTEGPREPC